MSALLARLRRFCPVALICLSPGFAAAEAVTVFAAASLKTALDAVADGFEAGAGAEVTLSYAGSSALARQIVRGAPADIFLSASPDWMDRVAAEGLLEPGSRRDLLGNRLVLIAPAPGPRPVSLDTETDLTALLGGGRLAMALVEAVPAGIYGRQALTHFRLWDAVAGQVAQTDNVRAALALVARGEASLGIVYATDARAEPRVAVLAAFPEESHGPILYPVARLARSGPEAAAFLAHLTSPEAAAIFTAHGFIVLVE